MIVLEKYKDKLAKDWQGISEKGPHFGIPGDKG